MRMHHTWHFLIAQQFAHWCQQDFPPKCYGENIMLTTVLSIHMHASTYVMLYIRIYTTYYTCILIIHTMGLYYRIRKKFRMEKPLLIL